MGVLNRASPPRDRNKYAGQHYAMTQAEYRQCGEVSLLILEELLKTISFLLADTVNVADIGITLIVRQFAHVDRDVFTAYLIQTSRFGCFPHVTRALEKLSGSDIHNSRRSAAGMED